MTEDVREHPEKFGFRWVEADLTVSDGAGVQTIRARRLVGRWEEMPQADGGDD